MSGVHVGLSLALERLRGVSAPLVLALSGACLYAVGVLEQRSDAASAPDDTLSAAFGLTLPVLAYLMLERVCAGQRLDQSLDGVARHGTDRRAALLGLLLGSASCMALASAVLSALALLGAHASGAHALMPDVRASVGIASLTGAVYALFFAAASQFGKRGGGRKWALVFDFFLGAGGSALAAPWPRGHARNLLGGEPVLGLSQAGAWFALAALGIVSVGLSLTRTES